MTDEDQDGRKRRQEFVDQLNTTHSFQPLTETGQSCRICESSPTDNPRDTHSFVEHMREITRDR